LLRQIADQHLDIPITLVWDNSKYQKCALVKDLAKSLNIELLYIPPYSPNSYLVERSWKCVKKGCLYQVSEKGEKPLDTLSPLDVEDAIRSDEANMRP